MTKIIGSIKNKANVGSKIEKKNLLSAKLDDKTLIKGIIEGADDLVGKLEPRNSIDVKIIGSGAKGEDGLSAYEVWLSDGNEGTIEDFFDSLKFDVEAGDLSYMSLANKPSIEQIELVGDKTFEELGLNSISKDEINNLL